MELKSYKLKKLVSFLSRVLSDTYEAIMNPKRALQIIETAHGWSIVVITDGKSNESLAKVIDSIYRELQSTRFEIIIVGPTSIKRLYKREEIRIVPYRELGISPGWITRKKNIGVGHSKYDKVVVSHDYVAFEPGWKKGFDEFGSDWDVCMNRMVNPDGTRQLDWIADNYPGLGEAILPYEINLTPHQYIGGRYMAVKRNFYALHPLDERYRWGEAEDVYWSWDVRQITTFRMNTGSAVRLLRHKPFPSPAWVENGKKIEEMMRKGRLGLTDRKAKVWIGMPAYNGARTLRETLDSFIDQSFKDWTLFVADDASTDDTGAICEEYAKKDSRIVYYRHPKNIGLFPNLAFALARAKGEYFMWAAQDDIWEKDFIAACAANLDRDPSIGIAMTGIEDDDSLGRKLRDLPEFARLAGKPSARTVARFVLQPEILGKCLIMYSLFRLSAIRNIWRAYPQAKEWGSDYIFSLAAISRYGIAIDPRVMFKKRQGGHSSSESIEKDRVAPRALVISNPKNHIFPFKRFGVYFRGHMKALKGTPYRALAAILLLSRLPRAFVIYMRERNFKKLIKR